MIKFIEFNGMSDIKSPRIDSFIAVVKNLPGSSAMLDLLLAIGHHLLIFAIFGIICAEFWAVRPGMNSTTVARIASLDLWYGILAAAILAVGFCRAIFAAKGWG